VDAETRARIRQIKLNALAAKHRHVQSRDALNRRNHKVDFLGLLVPVLYPFRYLAKGSPVESGFEIAWTLLAVLLAGTTAAKMAFRWSDKAQKHSELLGENISLVGHANSLLMQDTVSSEALRLFALLAVC
jgi:mobilome CxxCx(11)CxxC protein